MNPLSLNKNKSTIFILPIVFKDKKSSDLITDDFVNAYMADFNKPEFDDELIVVTKTDYLKNKITDHKQIDSYKNDDHTVQVYSLPEEYLSDYFKIISGEYSETSDSYKNLLLNFWEIDEKSTLYKILYGEKNDKTKKVKEILPSFSLSEEVYRMGFLL